MTEGTADGQAQLPGVLGRLQARAAQRAADAAKRLEALQSSADPRESVEGFMDAFSRQRQALEASLQALTAGGAAAVNDSSPTVGSLAADIAELDKVRWAAHVASSCSWYRQSSCCERGCSRQWARSRPARESQNLPSPGITSQHSASLLSAGSRCRCILPAHL